MRSSVLIVACAVALAACSEEPIPEELPPSGPHALFSSDPASLDNPFPDARLFSAAGGLDVSLRPGFFEPFLAKKALTGESRTFFNAYAVPFSELKGFGNFAPVLVRFSEAIDPATLVDAEGAPRFVYVVEGEAGWTRGPKALAEVPAHEILKQDGKHFAAVQPELPLAPNRPAYLALLSGVKSAAGQELVPSADFFAHARKEGAEAVAVIAAAVGRPASHVLFAMELKPADLLAESVQVRDWTRSGVKPTIEIPARDGDEPKGVFRNRGFSDDELVTFDRYWKGAALKTHEQVGAVILGRLGSRDFRTGGVWTSDKLQGPAGAPEVMLDFVLTLPKSAFEGDDFKDGVPVVIAQHGINGRNSVVKGSDDSFCLKMAELFASHGMACIGIDANGHGNRGRITDFFSVSDLRLVRDNFRQTYADLMQLVAALPNIDHDGDGKADLELAPRFFGQSLGGIMGTAFVSLDDRVVSPVLNVPGVGLSNILLAARIRDMAGVLVAAETGIDYLSEEYEAMFPLLRAIAQLVIEPGDPIHYAPLLKGRAALVQEGKDDLTIPNHTTRTLATLAGIPELFEGATSASGIAGLISFDAKSWGVDEPGYDPHNLFWSVPEQRTQAARYLQSRGTELVLERR